MTRTRISCGARARDGRQRAQPCGSRPDLAPRFLTASPEEVSDARACTVCRHPEGEEIGAAAVNVGPYRDIACMHAIGRMAPSRHRAHIRTAPVETATRQEEAKEIAKDPRASLEQIDESSASQWSA